MSLYVIYRQADSSRWEVWAHRVCGYTSHLPVRCEQRHRAVVVNEGGCTVINPHLSSVPDPLYETRIVDRHGRVIGVIHYSVSSSPVDAAGPNWYEDRYVELAARLADEAVDALVHDIASTLGNARVGRNHLEPDVFVHKLETPESRYFFFIGIKLICAATRAARNEIRELLAITGFNVFTSFSLELIDLRNSVRQLTPN